MTRFRRSVRAAGIVFLTAAFLAPAPARSQADPFAGVRSHILAAMADRDLPSVSVAVARGGEVLWEEAFGWADREARWEATPHTMYSLASISKPITATAVMMLSERGAVDLDAPVNRYLGTGRVRGLAADSDGSTVARVLSHTAGLPLHYQFFYESDPERPPTPDESISRYAIVTDPPGRAFLYSNIGYGVLDHVVARVSGRSFGDFLRTEIFVPLGMTRTSLGIGPGLEAYAATRYGEDQRPLPYYVTDHPGASEVYASAHDLVRFGLFHLGWEGGRRSILSEEARRRMRERATPDLGTDGYGLGWFVADEFGHRKVWHTGSMPGVSTMLALYPDHDVVVVVLINALARDLRVTINQEIAAAVIPGYAEARSRAAALGGSGDEPPAGGGLPPSLTGRWVGTLRTWSGEQAMALEVHPDSDVHVELEGQLAALLNGPAFSGGRLTGRFAGQITTSDALRVPRHYVSLNLRLEGDVLAGQATALPYTALSHYALTSYVRLQRER